MSATPQNLSALLWSVADLLRGDFRQSEYGRVILPFTVLRRLDCVLAPTKAAVLQAYRLSEPEKVYGSVLTRKTGLGFYNTSALDLPQLMGDQDHLRDNLESYVQAFSADVRAIFERFDFAAVVERLHKAKLLYLVTEKFANLDLHPDTVDNAAMGTVFEELIRKFAEISNETAGEHFTPREVIRLMVGLLFLLHLLSKMRPEEEGGCRLGIVLNGSPLFTGGAGSGESEIRRHVLENDLVEAIIALPTDMFYNTGISTYVWILSNRKQDDRRGLVQLIDASGFWQKMRKSLGSKRKELSEAHIGEITRLFGAFMEANLVTVFDADGREAGRSVVPDGTWTTWKRSWGWSEFRCDRPDAMPRTQNPG